MNLILIYPNELHYETVLLTSRRAKHIIEVIKPNIGDQLTVGLFNGNIGNGEVLEIDKESFSVRLRVDFNQPPPQQLPLTLILALPRPKTLKKALHAAITIGVKNIHLINSYKVDKSYWQTPHLSDKGLKTQIELALEQSKDTVPPTISVHKRFKPFVEDEFSAIINNTTPLLAHPTAEEHCPFNINAPTSLIIGPEGGFTEYEVDMLIKHGANPVTIGEHILRVEFAIPAIIGKLF